MNNPDRNSDKTIVLEDLLKIKRHEKPDAAFWEKFDQQLHHKTLEKLVYKPSLRSRFSSLFTFSPKPVFSAAALALLTITMQPTFFSRTASVLVESTSSIHPDNLLSEFASAKRNYIKNNIAAVSDGDCGNAEMFISSSTLKGVRYIAGTIAQANFPGVSISNNIY